MSERYKIKDQRNQYFITFAVAGWVDVFTRREYVELLLESIRFCQKNKGLEVYGWCIMSNHVHFIIGSSGLAKMEDIIRDLKKYTSRIICKAILDHPGESRKEWMLRLFHHFAKQSKKHVQYMFWQNEFHPVELSRNEIAIQKLQYIHENPVKSGIVENASDYRYSSAIDYETNRKGLLELFFL